MKEFIFALTFLIPGTGQMINKQFKKGILGLVFTILVWMSMITQIIPTLNLLFYPQTDGDYSGAVTIGAEPYINDSFLILVGSVFYLVLIAGFLLVSYAFARDAKKSYIALKNGEKLQSSKERFKTVAPDLIPHMVSSPAYIMVFLFILIPAIISIFIVFTNYETPILPPAFLIEWVGFENFINLFTDPKLTSVFRETLVWTIVWTFCASMLTIILGISLALLVNKKEVKGKKFFRSIYLLPWAVPAFLTILIFQIFFSKIGAANTIIIPFFTGNEYAVSTAVGFLQDPFLAKITIILIQAWLGFPFVFILTTGVLQGIPDDLYEAASIDGASAWTKFWDITFPMIMIAAAPMLITQFTFNFNNVTIIYLLGGSVAKEVGAQYGELETIASLGYQLMLDSQFATAAVFTLITSVLVSTVVLISWIRVGAFKNEEVF
jgi:arabinogalactan oligomer/maltooligosaccharide transport system permease protein